MSVRGLIDAFVVSALIGGCLFELSQGPNRPVALIVAGLGAAWFLLTPGEQR